MIIFQPTACIRHANSIEYWSWGGVFGGKNFVREKVRVDARCRYGKSTASMTRCLTRTKTCNDGHAEIFSYENKNIDN